MKVKARITTANNRTTDIEFTTDSANRSSDIAALKEIYGEKNVEVLDS